MNVLRVSIKKETFETKGMEFLEKKGFSPNKTYSLLGTVGQKLLIADPVSGEMVELFPRNCVYQGEIV